MNLVVKDLKMSACLLIETNELFSDCQQPRSCLKTSLRVDPAPVEEPAAAWTCRKLHRRAEVASAAGAGTNTAPASHQSRRFDQPDQLLPKPCSDQLPYDQHSTNKLLANEWPVNCQPPPPPLPRWSQLLNRSARNRSSRIPF